MTKGSPIENAFYFRLGMGLSSLFTLVCIAIGTWTNAVMLGLLFGAFALGSYLMDSGRKRAAMHVVVAAMLLQQLIVLYLYRDTPNLGLIWFLIVPSIVASMSIFKQTNATQISRYV